MNRSDQAAALPLVTEVARIFAPPPALTPATPPDPGSQERPDLDLPS